MDEADIPKRRTVLRRRLQSSALAAGVVVGTIGVGYGLLQVFGPEPTPTARALMQNGKIAFVGSTNPDHPANTDIFAANPDGTELVQLTDDPAPEYDPAWSPDGTKIAFAREGRQGPNGVAFTSLYVADADKGNVTRLTSTDGRSPAWSPDGSKIAFSRNRQGASDIWMVNADGTGLRQLTDLADDGVAI